VGYKTATHTYRRDKSCLFHCEYVVSLTTCYIAVRLLPSGSLEDLSVSWGFVWSGALSTSALHASIADSD